MADAQPHSTNQMQLEAADIVSRRRVGKAPHESDESGAQSEGRFGKQDFVYLADENVYRCPAGEKLKYRFTAEEHGQKLHRYWTDACHTCPI